MNFKNLLEKYKSGTITPDEKMLVEAELEKNEAINEYLSDQLMDVLPSADSVERAFDSKAEAKKIRKRINRKFIATVAASVAIVAALACVTLFAIFPAINNLYYNPLTHYVYHDPNEPPQKYVGLSLLSKFSFDMSVFSELNVPGITTPLVISVPRGFGVYDMMIYQNNVFRNNESIQTNVRLVRGKLEPKLFLSDFYEASVFNQEPLFYHDFRGMQDISDYAADELTRLPESALVKAYLFFEEPVDMLTLAEYVQTCGTQVLWAGIDSTKYSSDYPYNEFGTYGFNPMGKVTESMNTLQYNSLSYPLLMLDSGLRTTSIYTTPEEIATVYETHFTSLLNYMNDNSDFTEMIGWNSDQYGEVLEYIEQHGVRCSNIVVSGTRDEIIALAENPLVKYIAIDDVMISEFSRR